MAERLKIERFIGLQILDDFKRKKSGKVRFRTSLSFKL